MCAQVGDAFVNKYRLSEHVHRFYQDANCFGRPTGAAADGMDTVTT
jgi:hypothetical protein